MPPQQPMQTSNQYDFILNNGKNGGSRLTQASQQTRILMVLGGLLGLAIVAIIFLSIITSGNGVNTAQLTEIVQRQAEIARITFKPITQADQQTTQNFAATTYLSISSDEQTLLQLLGKLKATPKAEVIAARRSAATDAQLQAAQSNGTFDTTFTGITEQQLAAYVQALRDAFASSHSTVVKSTLQNAFNHAQLLIALGQKT